MVDLAVNIGNLTLKNPILTASGTFGYGEEYAPYFDLNILGGLITKTITLKPRTGNPFPRVVETPAGMLNSIGLTNVGVEAFIEEKLPYLNKLDTKIIVNIAGFTVEEYFEIIKLLEQVSGIAAYELNVSCPNVKQGGVAFGSDANITAQITGGVKSLTDRTVIVKLTPNVTDICEIALAAQNAGADAVSLINTLVGMAVDVSTKKPKLAAITGGLSGPAIKPVALAKVYQVTQRVNIPVIGVGGIMNYEDVLEFLIVGATAVQIGTANFVDPSTCESIIQGLKLYCEENKITNINQLIATIIT